VEDMAEGTKTLFRVPRGSKGAEIKEKQKSAIRKRSSRLNSTLSHQDWQSNKRARRQPLTTSESQTAGGSCQARVDSRRDCYEVAGKSHAAYGMPGDALESSEQSAHSARRRWTWWLWRGHNSADSEVHLTLIQIAQHATEKQRNSQLTALRASISLWADSTRLYCILPSRPLLSPCPFFPFSSTVLRMAEEGGALRKRLKGKPVEFNRVSRQAEPGERFTQV
jgi:hypothetical protein